MKNPVKEFIQGNAKHLDDPHKDFQRIIKKQAPVMYEAITKVRNDPAFEELTPEVQTVLMKLIEQLQP